MALKPEEQKKLKILLVVVAFMLAFHGYRYYKKGGFGKARVRRRHGRPVRSIRRTASRGRAGGRRPVRRSRALTPNDIPRLSEETKRKLKALKNPKKDLIPEDELRYETRNPFLPIELSDKQVEQMKRAAEVKARGGKVSADTIYFRGVAHINGEKLAILERSDRTMPWYVREGERLTDTDYILQKIAANDMQVSLLNTKAKRERDRIRTIPWSGLEGSEEAAALLAGATNGRGLEKADSGERHKGGDGTLPAGHGPAGGSGSGKGEIEPGADDFEIME